MKQLGRKLTKASGEDGKMLIEEEIHSSEAEMAKSALVVIVFSAMVIEAYIRLRRASLWRHLREGSPR